jgi:putative transposase
MPVLLRPSTMPRTCPVSGSTRQNPNHTAAPDLVDRDFRVTEPNRLWMADLTRLVTGEGVLWLASVRDAFANRIVGWATDPRATTTLVLTALNHALRSRDVRAGQLIFHSDKGAQYTALRFTQRLVDAGVAPSTGSTGDSYDNALAENLWSTIKVELVYWPGTTFTTAPRPSTRGPLHRRLVQPAPNPGRPRRTLTRRVRGRPPSRPTQSQRQVSKTPANRGKLTRRSCPRRTGRAAQASSARVRASGRRVGGPQ